jgi:hypothetical protein
MGRDCQEVQGKIILFILCTYTEIVLTIAHLVALILKQKYVSLKIKVPQLKKHIQLKEIVDNFIK